MDSFKIKSKEDFIDMIGITEDVLSDAISNKKVAYSKFNKRKKNGFRDIYAIDKNHKIYQLQKNLNNRFFKNILFPDCVFGFCKCKSYFDFLVPHILNSKKRYYLRLDISDFFGSIDIFDIEESLDYYIDNSISDDESEEICQNIIEIISLDNKIVQGAITSPVVSNLVFRSLDIRIEKYCARLGVKYTRYADDMLFSAETSYVHNYKFTNAIKAIIYDKGFELNLSKTLKYSNEISLSGYVVGTDIRLSRKKYKAINKIIYEMSTASFKGFTNRQKKYYIKNQLAGYRSFLIQTIRYVNDNSKMLKIERKIQTIEHLIRKYCVEYP